MTFELKIVNWNIGGAKYLELRNEPLGGESPRQIFKQKLGDALNELIRRHRPHIVTLQEIVEYEENGVYKKPESVLPVPFKDYDFYPSILIDTRRHSHQGKWDKVRKLGGWRKKNVYFGQGNGILIKKGLNKFPLFSLPTAKLSYRKWRTDDGLATSPEVTSTEFVEVIPLEPGLYFGARDTEPRAASVIHLVFEREKTPQDIFIINAHLTTLTLEREGVPSVDREASEKRLRQLSTIFDDIISRYNRWAKEKYTVRGKVVKRPSTETIIRHPAVWIAAGDFNFTPESEEYAYVKRRNFLDLVENHGLGTKASGLGKDPTLTVDYIFAGPLFEVIDPHKIKPSLNGNVVQFDDLTSVSDHFPVCIKLPFDALKPLAG